MKKSENKPFILLALIATTAVVDSISGSVRATVFAKNKGGAYIRGKGIVLNPNTALQSAVRSIFTLISQAWSGLTEPQRSSWIEKTPQFPYQNRLGQQRELTGKALFQQLNNNLLNIGKDLITSAPLPSSVPGIIGINDKLEVVTSLSKFTFDFKIQGVTDKSLFILEVTPPLSPGVTNASNQFRKLLVSLNTVLTNPERVGSNDFVLGTDTIYDSYVRAFGVPTAGEKIFIRIKAVNVDTGQAGTYFKSQALVEEV